MTDNGGTDSYDDMVNVTMSNSTTLLGGLFEVIVEVTMPDTMDSDSGDYLCNATNAVGSATATFSLLVQCM